MRRAEQELEAALALLADRTLDPSLAALHVRSGHEILGAAEPKLDPNPTHHDVRAAARALHLAIRSARKTAGIKPRIRWATVATWGGIALFATLPWVVMALPGGDTPWRGRYYEGTDLEGDPRTRLDEAIDFEWVDGSPMAGMPIDRFSVRWDTCLDLEEDTSVHFELGTDDGSRLFVDDEMVVNAWRPQAGNWQRVDRALSAGPHHVRIEYYELGGSALAVFRMSGPSGPLVPSNPPEEPDGGCAE